MYKQYKPHHTFACYKHFSTHMRHQSLGFQTPVLSYKKNVIIRRVPQSARCVIPADLLFDVRGLVRRRRRSVSCVSVFQRARPESRWLELQELQTDQSLLRLLLRCRRRRRRIGREKALRRRSRWRGGGAGASSLVVGLVVELVVELADGLVVELIVELVVELIVELIVGLVGGLVGRLVDEARGSGLAAVLHADGELGGVQRLQNAIHVQAESEGVCGQGNQVFLKMIKFGTKNKEELLICFLNFLLENQDFIANSVIHNSCLLTYL